MRVIPTADGMCPSCRQAFSTISSQVAPNNPFADHQVEKVGESAGIHGDLNPYASSALRESTSAKRDPLFAPAMVLLVGSMLWFLMVVCVVGLQMFAVGALASLPPEQALGELVGYLLMTLMPVATIAGAISMIKRQSKQTAWAGAIVALIPVCGPCYGLLIPFAIWAMIVMRRNEVSAQFNAR